MSLRTCFCWSYLILVSRMCMCSLDIEINHKHGKVVKLATVHFQLRLFQKYSIHRNPVSCHEHCCMQLYIMGAVVTRFWKIHQGPSKQQISCHCGTHAHRLFAGSASKRNLDGPPNTQMATASGSSSDSSLLRKSSVAMDWQRRRQVPDLLGKWRSEQIKRGHQGHQGDH